MTFIRQHKGAVVWSMLLHIAVVVGSAIAIPWPERPPVVLAAVPIQGVIIDQAAIERERVQREQAARAERQRVQREERERREQAEQQRATEQREKERVAAEQQARDDAARKERERVAAEKRAQEQRDQERREQQVREQREKEAAAKREREAAAQRRREAELQEALAAESERAQAEAAGLLDQYMLMLENAIKQHWDRPLSARPGLNCVVNVVQLPTGDVVSAKVGTCNGDDAVRRSIEAAVLDASPLPRPPTPSLFERSLNIYFQPDR